MSIISSVKINFFLLVSIPFSIYVGMEGLISWWVIVLIWLTHGSCSLTFKRR